MLRPTRLLLVVLVLQASFVHGFADDVIVEAESGGSGKMTVKSPYRFVLQKSVFKNDGYRLWGKLTDADGKPPRQPVTVVFTAYDAKGKFLARESAQVGDADRGGDPLGHINGLTLETDGIIPAKIVWNVVSEKNPYAGIKVVKSTDKTSSDTDLTFEVQRVGSGYRGMTVYGKVSNGSMNSYENLEVIVTVYDADGKFLGRGRSSVSPSKVEPGQVGYLDDLGLELGSNAPAKLEWKVIQSRF